MDKELQKLFEKSGNSLHVEVVKALRKKKFDTRISPYYMDEILNKPREIDIIAKWSNKSNNFNINLFIECKYIPSDVLLLTDTIYHEEISEVYEGIINLLPQYTEKKSQLYMDLNRETRYRTVKDDAGYYTHSDCVKLYNTKRNNNSDVIYDASMSSIKSLIYYKGNVKSNMRINYPVVIYNKSKTSKIEAIDINKANSSETKPIDDFLFHIEYSYKDEQNRPVQENFIIEFIYFKNIDKYLESIKTEMSNIDIKLFDDYSSLGQ